MKISFKFLIVLCVAFIISCKPENKINPETIRNTPSNIIVKEKSISGNFDSITVEMTLFQDHDSVYYDSISYKNFGGLPFNFSHFAAHKFIYFGEPNIIDGDSIAFVIQFDDNNFITSITDEYSISANQPYYAGHKADFLYDNNKRMNFFGDGETFLGGCNVEATGAHGNYYTNSNGNDSLVILTEVASCNVGAYEYDTIIVNFLSNQNNTNELYLSYPTISSRTNYKVGSSLSFLQYIPFPKMNGKLIDNVYYSKNGFSYKNTYTFDANNRVKTAKIGIMDKNEANF